MEPNEEGNVIREEHYHVTCYDDMKRRESAERQP